MTYKYKWEMKKIRQLKWIGLTLLLFLFYYPVMSHTIAENKGERKLTEVLTEISERYQVIITYDAAMLKDIKVDINRADLTGNFEQDFSMILDQTNLDYKYLGTKYYVIFKDNRAGKRTMRKLKRKIDQIQTIESSGKISLGRTQSHPRENVVAMLQSLEYIIEDINITGQVVDAKGEPLIGVNVLVKGTNKGTGTDLDGQFSLNDIDDQAVLVVSYIGYKSQEVAVGGQTSMTIIMQEDAQMLDEVVVVGYGTMRKSDLTGSVKRITMDDMAPAPNINLTQALSGAAAGVNILQSSGLAGRDATFSIRGQTSLSASNSPLIVLDGIIYTGALNEINTGDVESIDILKDASAAAVYGSRASNGVMIITTKKGKTDKPTISFNAYYGVQDMTNNPMKVMNADQYAIRMVDYFYQQDLYSWYRKEPTSDVGKPVRPDVTDKNAVAKRLRSEEEQNNYLAGNEIDWVDEVTRKAPIQNYQLSVSGRSDRSNYYLSGSYSDVEGILLNDRFKRLTTQFNFDTRVTDWLKLELVSSYSHLDFSGLPASLSRARSASPLANRKIGPDYELYLTTESYMPYPLNPLYVDNSDYKNRLFLVGKGIITIPWIQGLTNEFNYSYTNVSNITNSFYPVKTPGGATNRGQAVKSNTDRNNWILNNIVTYLRTFGDHRVNATLLYSRENGKSHSSRQNASGFDQSVLSYNNMSLGEIATVTSSAWEENSVSYMARANYSYLDRYMATATVRRDGFSGFGKSRKYATFPSISLAWVASEEPFLRDVLENTYFKLRTSYGLNGNQGIGRYSTFSKMGIDAYVYGSSSVISLSPSSLGNQDLGWETTTSVNFGLDYGFLDQRISGSIDVYTAKTTDVLVRRALPLTTGFSSIWTNIGGIQNNGIELELTTINLDNPNSLDRLRWETSFVFALNRDKITKLYGGGDDNDIGNSWFVGESIGAIYDYEMAGGLWTEEELYSGNILNEWYPGQFKYVDQNNDRFIKAGDDRKVIGDRNPNYRFSINNTISYKSFSFSFLINSIMGGGDYFMQDNYSVVNNSDNTDTAYRRNASAVRPYWTPTNGVNNSTGMYNAPSVLSGIYESRSFVRLQDISLSYRFGTSLLKSLNLTACQFYIASKNPYTWTKWSGWDPETGTSNAPLMRNITGGFKISL